MYASLSVSQVTDLLGDNDFILMMEFDFIVSTTKQDMHLASS
jgi:hypothetical protein